MKSLQEGQTKFRLPGLRRSYSEREITANNDYRSHDLRQSRSEEVRIVVGTCQKKTHRRRSSKHQMAAYCGCKRRHKKCDGKYPACSGCEHLGIQCTLIYPPTGQEISRDYLERLEKKVQRLQKEMDIRKEKKHVEGNKLTKSDLDQTQVRRVTQTHNFAEQAGLITVGTATLYLGGQCILHS